MRTSRTVSIQSQRTLLQKVGRTKLRDLRKIGRLRNGIKIKRWNTPRPKYIVIMIAKCVLAKILGLRNNLVALDVVTAFVKSVRVVFRLDSTSRAKSITSDASLYFASSWPASTRGNGKQPAC